MGVWGALKVLPMGVANIIRSATDIFILPVIGASTWDVLSSCSDNEHMKGVLTYCYGDYVCIRCVNDMCICVVYLYVSIYIYIYICYVYIYVYLLICISNHLNTYVPTVP